MRGISRPLEIGTKCELIVSSARCFCRSDIINNASVKEKNWSDGRELPDDKSSERPYHIIITIRVSTLVFRVQTCSAAATLAEHNNIPILDFNGEELGIHFSFFITFDSSSSPEEIKKIFRRPSEKTPNDSVLEKFQFKTSKL